MEIMNPEQLALVVEKLTQDCVQGHFQPILEADINAYLYHLLIREGLCTPQNLHADTRIVGRPNERFDLVLGSLLRPSNHSRPAVSAQTIIEIKAFPIGFTAQQHRVHLEHVLNDDLRKLGQLAADTCRIELLFDQSSYLVGRYGSDRRDRVVLAERDRTAPGAYVLLAQWTDRWTVRLY